MSREFKVWTGPKGEQQLHEALYDQVVVQPAREKAAELLCISLIDKSTYKSLMSMIESPDRENLEVATIIMDTKKPNQDDNIYSKDA